MDRPAHRFVALEQPVMRCVWLLHRWSEISFVWDLQIIEYSDTFLPSFVYLRLSFLKTFHSSSQFDAKSSFRKSLQLFFTKSKSIQLLSQLKQTEKVMSKSSSSQLMTQVDLYFNLIDNLSCLLNYCASGIGTSDLRLVIFVFRIWPISFWIELLSWNTSLLSWRWEFPQSFQF